MPPKAKLHKITGKKSSFPKPSTSQQENSNGGSESETNNFELELHWCIQQLQEALASGKLNEKQTQDSTRALRTLTSNSAPLVKKRQVMRLSFGDYRSKMAEEERKLNRISTNIRVSLAEPSKKSQYIKKAQFRMSSDNSFRFNFAPLKESEESINDIARLDINKDVDADATKTFRYQPSENSFRFNFINNE